MVRLLTEPPRTLPTEVEHELLALDEAQIRIGSKVGLIAFLSFNLYLPLVIAMGVRSVAGVALFFGVATAAGLVTHLLSRLVKHPRSQHSMIVLSVGISASAIAAGFFGPFLLVPSIATVITVLFSMNHRRVWRAAIIAVALAGVLLPAVLEWVSVIPPSMAFEGDRLVLLPRFVHFPRAASLVLLTTVNVAVVVMASLAMIPLRRELDEAQKRVRLNAWQLRQMVPHDSDA
jgi:MFS family permease